MPVDAAPNRLISVVLLVPAGPDDLHVGKRLAYTQMDTAFPLADSGEDAVHILVFLLRI